MKVVERAIKGRCVKETQGKPGQESSQFEQPEQDCLRQLESLLAYLMGKYRRERQKVTLFFFITLQVSFKFKHSIILPFV